MDDLLRARAAVTPETAAPGTTAPATAAPVTAATAAGASAAPGGAAPGVAVADTAVPDTAVLAPRRPSRVPRRSFELDSLALAASTAVTGLVGLAFWAAAARGYAPAEVGRGAALVSAATLLATLANVSLGGMYERFLPVTGRLAGAVLRRGALVTGSLAVLLGAGYVLLGPTDQLFTSTWERLAFPPLVAVMSTFALQDSMLTGLMLARWAAVKNVVHSVVKLVALVALASTASGYAVVGAWIVPAGVVAWVVAATVVRRALRDPRHAGDPDLPPRRELWHFFAGAYGITVVASTTPLAIPLIIVNRLGTAENAYFTISWTLLSAVSLLMATIGGPFIAEASGNPDRLPHLTRRLLLLLTAVGVGGGAFLLVGAPFLMGLLGKGYATESAQLVGVMGLALPFAVVANVYSALARVLRRLKLAVVLQCAHTAVLVTGVWVMVGREGLQGVGQAYLAVEVAVAVVLLVPTWRMVREVMPRSAAR